MHATCSAASRRCSPSNLTTPSGHDSKRLYGLPAYATSLLLALALVLLAGCGGGGGDDSSEPQGPAAEPQSLAFTYPANGQQDVALGSQIVANFGSAVSFGPDDFKLVAQSAAGAEQPIVVEQDNNQPDIYRITPVDDKGKAVRLAPLTTYALTVSGDTLFQFRTRPIAARPAGADGFRVVRRTPGTPNPVTGVTLPFTEFNTLHLILSAPVDAATVIKGESFRFTDGNGNAVAGRLIATGRYITFDPRDDLDSSQTYQLELTNAIRSQYGASLDVSGFPVTITPLDTGNTSTQSLSVVSVDGDNPLNGLDGNVAVIHSQLLGADNRQVASNPALGGVTTTLAEGGPRFGNINPAVIRAGQRVRLSKMDLVLSGAVDTPVTSGPVASTFISDVNVYLMGNQLRPGKTPVAVRLRFDMAITTYVPPPGSEGYGIKALANGLFTQTVMNIQAVGTMTVQENGDMVIHSMGSFPIKVNRVGSATIDLELRMLLASGGSGTQQPTVTEDRKPPFVTAVFPSACLYLFGSPAYGDPASGHVLTASAPEKLCLGALQAGNSSAPAVNAFPLEASPFVLFSEAPDPASVTPRSVTLLAVDSGQPVDSHLRVEGAAVVIDPAKPLAPHTEYAIVIGRNGMVTDLAGNAAKPNPVQPQKVTFVTAANTPSTDTPPFIASITPGLPCALSGGDFTTGGDVAGNCVGDNPEKTPNLTYEVFELPANQTVDIFLSKFAQADSIQMADGCLAGGGEPATQGTVAVQHMDGSGQCLGVVDGKLVATNAGDDKVRAFSLQPTNGFIPGERYWIVMCGTDGQCTTGGTIQSMDGSAINTDPLNNAKDAGVQGAGGPTYIMPFDATAPSDDFYVTQKNVPFADSNGDGFLNDYETTQAANSVIATIPIFGTHTGYLSLFRPVVIHDDSTQCEAVMAVTLPNGQPAVGAKPEHCLPVSLLPGGFSMITALLSGGALGPGTGPLLLRYPAVDGPDSDDYVDQPQRGYIVEQCKGTFQGEAYRYAPCFVANLTQTINAPDASSLLAIGEQQFNLQVFGPVTFEQNGRLLISLTNANTFALDALADATTEPGQLHFQLAAPPSHGGRAFPTP